MPTRSTQPALQLHSESEAQTMTIAQAIAQHLRGGQVIALEGPLGSGKTCFVRGLAAGLGLNPMAVSSPTFVICQEYETPIQGRKPLLPLVHIDAYRLSGPDELETIGWNEMLEAADAVIAIEWPRRIAAALPAGRVDVTFEHAGEHSRLLSIIGLNDEALRHLKSLADSSNASASAAVITCRICGARIDPDAKTAPFCSDRCRFADLNRWFNEGYRTSREMQADDDLAD